MRQHRVRAAAGLMALALALTACGGAEETAPADDSAPTEEAPAEEADVLVVGTTEKPSTIDPAKAYEKFASDLLFNTTDRLVELEPGTGDIVPGVAESWTISDDGLVYTFTLRDGVVFQDGSPLTSEDVKWSIERTININHPDGASFLIGSVESIETPDDLTVVITIAAPNVTFLSRLAYTVATIVPSDSGTYTAPDAFLDGPSAEDVAQYIQGETIVGSGPYQMTAYNPDEGATLEAWDGYWGTAPLIPTVRIQFFESAAQMTNALTNGEIDLNINDLGPAERAAAQATEGIEVLIGDGGRIRYIVIDTNQAPVDDAKVRRAMAANIDRDRIIEEVFEGAGQPIFSMVPPGYPASKDYISSISETLDAPVDIELWYPLNKYGDTEAALAEEIARSLNESGQFNVTTKSSDWAAEYSSNLNTGAYKVYLLGWYPDYIDPDDYIEPFYSSAGFIGFYKSDAMDALVKKEQEETDLAARAAIFDEIQQLAATDMPFIPLFEESATAYYASDLTGVESSVDIAIKSRWYLIGRS